jgi:hypothetical protein
VWVCRRDPSRRLPQLRHRHGVAPDKGVAVLLSVFWSFWTWLYIDKKDAGKFWIGLAWRSSAESPPAPSLAG